MAAGRSSLRLSHQHLSSRDQLEVVGSGDVPLRRLLSQRGAVREISVEHPRYIGHKLGVYNPQGEKVGTPGAAKNREHLFVVACRQSAQNGSAPDKGRRHGGRG